MRKEMRRGGSRRGEEIRSEARGGRICKVMVVGWKSVRRKEGS